jgi:hypothetical protein
MAETGFWEIRIGLGLFFKAMPWREPGRTALVNVVSGVFLKYFCDGQSSPTEGMTRGARALDDPEKNAVMANCGTDGCGAYQLRGPQRPDAHRRPP